ncbi:hypothetical protein [Phenylobacterium sp.]|uniref:hypothetical protein n=1 Tax=Phenylobacterium sp. TaxID=1871053 RepID=UPI002610CBF8|nr:hypothetical protein [Phenylobacterium sp.]
MDDPFIQIDKAATSERLKLRERGAEQGRLEQPPTHLKTLDATEAEIVGYVLEVYARAQNDAGASIRTYDGRIAELALLGSVTSIRTSARRAAGDFNASVANAMNRLSNSRDAITSSYAELREFRLAHGLQRPAHSALSGVAAFGAIAGSWAVETIINALILRQNDAMGYLGGVIAAAVIAILNVGLAAVVGRQVWPMTVHRRSGTKVLGWSLTIAWMAIAVLWNLGAAHYRDAKVSGVDNPEVQALAMMGGGLDSIYSWGLLIAGILLAGLAALAGFRMDDPYPGYGRVWQRHEARCQEYADDVQNATEEIRDIRDEAADEAVSVQEALAGQLAERNQILSARMNFVRRFGEFGDQLEMISNGLLQDYRTANLTARSTPPPETFLTAWTLQKSVLPPSPPSAVSDADVKATEKALEEAINGISNAFDEAIARFEPLDELKRKLSDA